MQTEPLTRTGGDALQTDYGAGLDFPNSREPGRTGGETD
jgi:hypothetical protein